MELKPCPFCGNQPVITKHFKEEIWNLLHRCNIVGVISIDWSSSEQELIDRWNTRVAPEKSE